MATGAQIPPISSGDNRRVCSRQNSGVEGPAVRLIPSRQRDECRSTSIRCLGIFSRSCRTRASSTKVKSLLREWSPAFCAPATADRDQQGNVQGRLASIIDIADGAHAVEGAHQPATHAAKYAAPSNESGKLEISHRLQGREGQHIEVQMRGKSRAACHGADPLWVREFAAQGNIHRCST